MEHRCKYKLYYTSSYNFYIHKRQNIDWVYMIWHAGSIIISVFSEWRDDSIRVTVLNYIKNYNSYEKNYLDKMWYTFSVASVRNINCSDKYLVNYDLEVHRNWCQFPCSVHYCFTNVTNIGIYPQAVVKSSNITSHGNSFGGSQAVTYRLTDMEELPVALSSI